METEEKVIGWVDSETSPTTARVSREAREASIASGLAAMGWWGRLQQRRRRKMSKLEHPDTNAGMFDALARIGNQTKKANPNLEIRVDEYGGRVNFAKEDGGRVQITLTATSLVMVARGAENSAWVPLTYSMAHGLVSDPGTLNKDIGVTGSD